MRIRLIRAFAVLLVLLGAIGLSGCSKPEEDTAAPVPPPVAAGQDGPQAAPASGPGAGAGAATATN